MVPAMLDTAANLVSAPVRTRRRWGDIHLELGDALDLYRGWPAPVVIISDGPYGLSQFPGDPASPADLVDAYRPHVEAWSEAATPETTLWFWNSEIGWATVHPLLAANGWEYKSCNIWDKGPGHIAGNANSKTLRQFPVVSEVCVQYTRRVAFRVGEDELSMQEWLRHEWRRSGLPFAKANEACGVANAATRKYLTACHLWYFPPPRAFARLARYANENGDPSGRPYFSIDGCSPISEATWERMRSKFSCEVGVTNVWREPQVRGSERLKAGTASAHMNQKPLRLLDLIIRASSDPGDTVWEPFGGLCSAAVAAQLADRSCFASEIIPEYFELASDRIEGVTTKRRLLEESAKYAARGSNGRHASPA